MHDPIDPEELPKAVALFYDRKTTPTVTAKGIGNTAEEIVAIAQDSGVPLCDNPALLELLMAIELGDEIPEALYIAIAHIIAFAYQLQGKFPDYDLRDL